MKKVNKKIHLPKINWPKIKQRCEKVCSGFKKACVYIYNFIQEFPSITFLIMSAIILIVVIHVNEKEIASRQPIIIEIPEPIEYAKDEPIPQDLKQELSDVMVTIFYDVPYYYTRMVTHTDDMQIDIAYPGLADLYATRNIEVEAQLISTYKQLKALYSSYGKPNMEITLYITDENNPELIYFSIEYGQVNWTRYDQQIKWREGDDLTEWETNIDGASLELLRDEEYQKYLTLMNQIRLEREQGASVVYSDN